MSIRARLKDATTFVGIIVRGADKELVRLKGLQRLQQEARRAERLQAEVGDQKRHDPITGKRTKVRDMTHQSRVRCAEHLDAQAVGALAVSTAIRDFSV